MRLSLARFTAAAVAAGVTLTAACAGGDAGAPGNDEPGVAQDASAPEAGPAGVAPNAAAADSAARAVAAAFDSALAAGDTAAVLALLDPELLVFEGGHAETLDEYRGGHLGADMAFTAAVPRTIERESVAATPAMAVYMSEYTAKGSYRGRDIDSRGAETMVMVRAPDGWKIRHIHWSSGR